MKLITLLSLVMLVVCEYSASLPTQEDLCTTEDSCASCVNSTQCFWCVNKSKCTRHSCGNDNVIKPEGVLGLLSGGRYCPRLLPPKVPIIINSGETSSIQVKMTQLYIFMAFTQWKCKISLEGKETTVNATTVDDTVYCDPLLLTTGTDKSMASGALSVLWDNSKYFDGRIPLQVQRLVHSDAPESISRK